MFPRRRALPHRPCSRCLTDLPPEPQLPFSILNQCLLMLAVWSCGRRDGLVQAQRQIHRAFRAAYTIAEVIFCAIADETLPAGLMRKARSGRRGSEYRFGARLLGA